MYKKFLIFLISIISAILFGQKINALNIAYCDYGNDTNLILPVTIGVKIQALHKRDPLNGSLMYKYETEYLVYDKDSCETSYTMPTVNQNTYMTPKYTYYYKYNEEITYTTSKIHTGTYTNKNLTPPSMSSVFPGLVVTVNEYRTLDEISSYVFAYDDFDGKLIGEITYENYSNNYDKLGVYSIMFEACDSDNNCSNLNFPITVVDDVSPEITGKQKFLSYISAPLSINDVALQLTAIDNYDGDISDEIYVKNHNYNPKYPGIYTLYFSVNDSSLNSSKNTFKVEVEVIDDIPPTIEGPTHFQSKLSSMIDTKNVLSTLIITDNIDSNLYNNIYIIDDTYTKNKMNIGEYTLVVGCYDKSQNESLPYIITISVVDDIPPSIEGKTNYESYISTPISINQIISNLLVTDNYDGNIINKLEITNDTYSTNKENIGIYSISFIVQDSSDNISNPFLVEITIYDDIIPIINGTNFYSTLTNAKLDYKSLLLSLSAQDNIDGDISSKIILDTDSYSDNFNIPGTYFMSFYTSDSSGNISNYFKIKIVVEESLSFLQSINKSHIFLTTDKQYNDDSIFELLNIDTTQYIDIKTIENTYLSNYQTPGKYNITYAFTNHNYTHEYLTLNISNHEGQKENTIPFLTTLENKKKENIFHKILSFFKSLWANLTRWIVSLFH